MAILVGGPSDGHQARISKTSAGVVPYMCRRKGGGPWARYERGDDGNYHFERYCPEGEHRDEFCDVRWDDPSTGHHQCRTYGRHTTHQCCCGQEHVN